MIKIIKTLWHNITKVPEIKSYHVERLDFLGISTLGWAVISMFAGTAVSAFSSFQQGQAQSVMSGYNALIARQNADLTSKRMELAKTEKKIIEQRFRKKSERTLATQRASFAKAGVEAEGTPLIVAEETAAEIELDALAIRYAGTVEQSRLAAEQAGFEQADILSRMRGSQARIAGRLGAGSTLLTGLGRTAGIFTKRGTGKKEEI
ncbi:hypothetical protein LCGC14_0863670 [marine sediment metagenome]|uniref:Uncharacterized protein n=1 Tax=marine sediment metagenome TaxID=412755 RepID=A0A0F9RRB0_9ZZZZ